jgi:hypothetical protein
MSLVLPSLRQLAAAAAVAAKVQKGENTREEAAVELEDINTQPKKNYIVKQENLIFKCDYEKK